MIACVQASKLIKYMLKCLTGVRYEFKILISKTDPGGCRRVGVEGMVVFYSVRILFRSLDPGVLPLP